jgi:putative MATE family efflux protein
LAARPDKSIVQLAWPLILSFTMRSLFNFVDTGFAATLGDESVAAIGLTWPLEFLFIAFWVGTSTGMTSLLSSAIGAKESERFSQVVKTAWKVVAFLIPFFLLLGALTWLLAPRLTDYGLAPGLVSEFRTYAAVLVAGTALTGFWSIIPDSIIKAHHDTKATMWAGIWSNLVNVALNALFLFVFHWGIFGIALSTVIGRFGGLLYAIVIARRHEAERRAECQVGEPGVYARPFRALLKLALPAALTYGLVGIEALAVNALLARAENATASIAAFTIYSRFYLFFAMPLIATGVALLPFTGRLFGRKDFDGIRAGYRQVALMATGYSLLFVLPVTWILRRQLVALFAESATTEELAARAMLAVPIACLVSVPFFACRPIFEGMQEGFPGLAVALLRYVVLTAPSILVGFEIAKALERPCIDGILFGLVSATFVSSLVFLAWMHRSVSRQEARFAATPA